MQKIIRKSFIKDDLIITYSNPSIQTSRYGKRCDNVDNILYFYYTIQVLYKGGSLVEDRAHDFPKIEDLPKVIDDLLSDDNYLLESENGKKEFFHRLDYYKRIKYADIYEMEYGYLFEVEKIICKQADEEDYTVNHYYTMSIYNPSRINNRWYREDRDIYTTVKITMTRNELLQLKQLAEEFMSEAIEQYNKYEVEEGK